MVYIVVLNWNGWKDTIACLESLMHLNYPEYKIVVCDNHSSDDSVEQIHNWHQQNKSKISYLKNSDYQQLKKEEIDTYKSISKKGVYLIQTGDNLGYAGGNNIGLQFSINQTDMDYVWLLNNDTEVTPNSLSYMHDKFKQDNKTGICGSKLVYFHDKKTIQALGGIFNFWLCSSKHYAIGLDANTFFNDDLVSQHIDYIVGASSLISKKCLKDIGLMCEDYFLYYEEIDWAIRAKRKGYNLAVSTDSIIYHKEGASIKQLSGFADYCFLKNRVLLFKKFYKNRVLFAWLSLFVSLLKRILKGNKTGVKSAIFAILGVKWQR